MTEKLYDNDSFLKEFTATVLSCDETENGYRVLLDRTAFFPEGGGQPCDKGSLGGTRVFDVQIISGEIFHFTDRRLTVGQAVTGAVCFERRFDFMQQHSGEHIVSGVAHRLFGCENVGFHLSEDIVTLDFDKPLSDGQIREAELQANKAVFENKRFYTYYPDNDRLKAIEYRSKKELDGAVRIVEIEDTDICACCAPHVKTAGQIGIIKLLSASRLRGGVRIELKAGYRALADYNERFTSTSAIGDMLAVKYNETSSAVERILHNSSELKAQITQLKKQLTEEKLRAFDCEKEISVLFEDNLQIKELQIYADALYKKAGGIRAVLSGQNGGFAFAVCGEAQKLDGFFDSFKNSFTVKGGGRNGMVQGTVFADKEQINMFFQEHLNRTKQ